MDALGPNRLATAPAEASFGAWGVLASPRVGRIEPALIQKQLPSLRQDVINIVHSEVDDRRLLRINLTAGRFGRNPRDGLIDGAADRIELSERAGCFNRVNDFLRPRQDERRVWIL